MSPNTTFPNLSLLAGRCVQRRAGLRGPPREGAVQEVREAEDRGEYLHLPQLYLPHPAARILRVPGGDGAGAAPGAGAAEPVQTRGLEDIHVRPSIPGTD